jgi:serine/threonine protein kinase/formylglycine-generating enzyme required for sulfatase activity
LYLETFANFGRLTKAAKEFQNSRILSHDAVPKPRSGDSLVNTLNQTPEHPANEELAAFALGKDTPNAETIAEHIANCPRCETLIAKTPRDTFLGILNKAKPGSSLTGPHAPKLPVAEHPAKFSADELPEELPQQTKYTFLKKLGGGGMGVVYLAEHNLMKRKVAVKLIPPELIGNPAVRERFLREVVSAAALEHPNVVRAYSAEEFGQHMLFEMEFVDGSDLGKVVKSKGPLPVVFAVNYIKQAAQALQHGMLKSLVHRDIKPCNLMLTRAGSVKVADFGLAKFSRETDKSRGRSLTGMNAMMGTPDYMAPEQARNAKTADIRADIYSLGCTFYYLLTGQPPFAGESIADLIFRHWEEPRPDVCVLRNDVPAGLSQHIQRMMAKEPGDRPQTPKEVADWLVKFPTEPTKKGTVEKSKVETSVDAKEKTNDDWNFQEFAPEPAVQKTAITQGEIPPKKKWPMTGGAIACILALVVLAPLACWLVLRTPNGTLVVEIADKDVEARIKGGKLILTGPDGKLRYTLTPSEHDNTIEAGAYKVHVEGADGLTLDTPEFTLKKGDTVTVRVTVAPIRVVKKQSKKVTPIPDLAGPIPLPEPTPNKEPILENGDDKGFVSLFNGKNLDGWEAVNSHVTRWSASDGVLVGECVGPVGPKNVGFLVTKQNDFANFHLRVKTKICEGQPCSLAFRLEENLENITKGLWPKTYLLGLGGTAEKKQTIGSISDPMGRMHGEADAVEVEPGRWVVMDLIATANHFTVRIDGKQVLRSEDAANAFRKGRIGLQCRPFTVIKFAKIEIRIDPKVEPKVEPTLVPLPDPTGRKPGEVVEVEVAKGMKMKFCWIPAGKATLGSPTTEAGRYGYEVEHEFTTKGFWLGKYAVTQEQWEAVMGKNPSWFAKQGGGKDKVQGLETARFPVEQVSWNDCQDFLKKLNEKITTPATLGKGKFSAPQDDEWEYACRGGKGNKQPFYFGDQLNGAQANCDGNFPYGTTTTGRLLGRTSEVGGYEKAAPHPWGLCDMCGNVYQWCETKNGNQNIRCLCRGGCWRVKSTICRSANKAPIAPESRDSIIGFRVVLAP